MDIVSLGAFAHIMANEPNKLLEGAFGFYRGRCNLDSFETSVTVKFQGATLYQADVEAQRDNSVKWPVRFANGVGMELNEAADEYVGHWSESYWTNGTIRKNSVTFQMALKSADPLAFFYIGEMKNRHLDPTVLGDLSGMKELKFYENEALRLGSIPALNTRLNRSMHGTLNPDDLPFEISQDILDKTVLYAAKSASQNSLDGMLHLDTLRQAGFDTERALEVVKRVGLEADLVHFRSVPSTDRAPTGFQISQAFNEILLVGRCNDKTAFLNGQGVAASLMEINKSGSSCIVTDAASLNSGTTLSFKVGQIFDPNCEGSDGSYTCTFSYNINCRVLDSLTFDPRMNALFCLPFRAVRQNASAALELQGDGKWQTLNYQLLP